MIARTITSFLIQMRFSSELIQLSYKANFRMYSHLHIKILKFIRYRVTKSDKRNHLLRHISIAKLDAQMEASLIMEMTANSNAFVGASKEI